jgi:transcriptional regulator with XRE-family HTH domain
METDVTFGRRLRELRRLKGMSQRELAERVGVDFTYLSKIENDRMLPPGVETIATLARILAADVDELSVLAGKIPPDVADILRQNLGALKAFRSLAGDVRTKADWQRYLTHEQRESSA